MNCTQCQTANDPGSTFCGNCGASLLPAAPAGYGGPASNQAPAAPQYQPGQAGPFSQRSSALPPASFDLSRLTTIDRVIAGATLVTMISLWLPWYSGKYSLLGVTSTASVSGTREHGWLWLEFILALALLGYFVARAAWEQLPFSLPVTHEWLLIGGTGLQFLLILIGFIALPSTDGLQGFSVSWDFGAFLALIASVVAAGPVIYPAVKTYLDSRNAGATRAS
ncbi:MAG TPA: zinc ribbon domain-containing protein [Trebonia sp.]